MATVEPYSCPEPFWHETHMYCPCCSWMYEEPSKKAPFLKETVYKPWGKYENLADYPGYRVKILTINPGHRISLQRHRWRDEHWYIVEGRGLLQIEQTDNTEYPWKWADYQYKDDSINIRKGIWHRITNQEQTPLVIVEVQMGNCFEEDIDRREDDYERT